MLISLLSLDFSLSYYGRNYSVMEVSLPFGFNTDYDNEDGFKIEDEGFIQILGKGDDVNNVCKINRIKRYTFNTNSIYCEVDDQIGKNHILQITYDHKRKKGDRLIYNFVKLKEINENLYWFNLDGHIVKLLTLLRILLLGYTMYLTFCLLGKCLGRTPDKRDL